MKVNQAITYVDTSGYHHTAVVSKVEGAGGSGHKLLNVGLTDGRHYEQVPHLFDRRHGEGYWMQVDEPEPAAAVKPEPEPEPEPEEQEDASAGWPEGYAWSKRGRWVAVTAPDGSAVESERPSGKWAGEDEASDAAWQHARAEQA